MIFPGAHLRASNVSKDRCWIEDDVYTVNGVEKVCTGGQPIPAGLGSALLDFRDQHPEMWKEMHDLGFRFYQ